MNNTISVIVPVYNVEKYLERCIKSIISQTYSNLEIILVNDGSSDCSGDICDKYARQDRRIKVIHKKNEGQAAARNDAMKVAEGDFFAFIDSDDYILLDMFEKLLKAMKETNSDISMCGIINDYGKIKREIKYAQYPDKIVYTTTEELFKSYFTTPLVGDTVWNKLYKRELWNGIQFPEIRAREDRMILYKVYGMCKRAVRISDYEYVQYIRTDSTERGQWNEDYIYSLKAGQEQKVYIAKNFPSLLPYTELIVAESCCNLMRLIIEKKVIKSKKQLYSKLYYILKQELATYKNHSLENENKYKYLLKICNNQFFFKNKVKITMLFRAWIRKIM